MVRMKVVRRRVRLAVIEKVYIFVYEMELIGSDGGRKWKVMGGEFILWILSWKTGKTLKKSRTIPVVLYSMEWKD